MRTNDTPHTQMHTNTYIMTLPLKFYLRIAKKKNSKENKTSINNIVFYFILFCTKQTKIK